MDSSIVAGCIWFVFCFRLNIFTSKISNLLIRLRGPGALNLDIPNTHIFVVIVVVADFVFQLFAASKDLIRDSQSL